MHMGTEPSYKQMIHDLDLELSNISLTSVRGQEISQRIRDLIDQAEAAGEDLDEEM
jgi:hypothetical protein